MIRNLVFDFGGVVVDLCWNNAIRRFAEIGLKQADVVLDRYRQQGIFLELEEGKISSGKFMSELSDMCGRQLTVDEVNYAWMGFFEPVSVSKMKILEELHRKYNMYLLSNTNPFVMDWARGSAFSSEGKGLDFYFDRLYLSYEMGVTKPDVEIFRRMIEDSGIVPEETLFVDDGISNIEAARSLGFDTLHAKEGIDWTESLISILRP